MEYQAFFKRYELKYVLDREQADAVRDAMDGNMVMDKYGRTPIHNIYYDTPDFLLARRSIERPFYKEKLRVRSYGPAYDDTEVFVEIKKKYDGVVYKRRLTLPYRKARMWLDLGQAPEEKTQIGSEIGYMLEHYGNLGAAMGLDYMREAYRTVDGSDFRVTLDDSITASCEGIDLGTDGYGFEVLPGGYTLMEVKTPGAIPLWLTGAMCAAGIMKTPFSKYGNAYRQMVLGKSLYEATGLKTNANECARCKV